MESDKDAICGNISSNMHKNIEWALTHLAWGEVEKKMVHGQLNFISLHKVRSKGLRPFGKSGLYNL